MTIQEIKNNIHYNENLIGEFSSKKRKVQAQIEELELLINKYIQLQEQFERKQQQRKAKLQKVSKNVLRNKMMQRYSAGMGALLEGSDYHQTCEGLVESRRRIKKKIVELELLLDDYENTIVYRRERREYWHAQLVIAMATEGNDGSKFNY